MPRFEGFPGHSIDMPSMRDGAEGPAIHSLAFTVTSPIPVTCPRMLKLPRSYGVLACFFLGNCRGAALPWFSGSILTVAAADPPFRVGVTWTESFPAAVALITRQVSGCQSTASL